VPRFVSLALTAALVCGGVASAEAIASSSASAAGRTTAVTGQVKHPLHLSRGALAKYKQHHASVTYMGGMPVETEQHHTFSGPLLLDVINAAGPRFSTAIKNDQLRWGLLVVGEGNYRALISWGEIEPKLENEPILLAITQDGKPLALPRLVIPGDHHGGRYVGGITKIKVSPAG
jgi:hypothetical protein